MDDFHISKLLGKRTLCPYKKYNWFFTATLDKINLAYSVNCVCAYKTRYCHLTCVTKPCHLYTKMKRDTWWYTLRDVFNSTIPVLSIIFERRGKVICIRKRASSINLQNSSLDPRRTSTPAIIKKNTLSFFHGFYYLLLSRVCQAGYHFKV